MTTILRLPIVLAIFTTLTLATPARAQEVTRFPDSTRQSIGVDGGLEAAFIARATYVRRLDLGFLPEARLFARFTLPVVRPDLGDWGVDGGAGTTPLAWRDFRLALLVGPLVRRATNELFSAAAIGVGVTILIGYEGQRWGLSAEGGYEQIFAAYLHHSDLYRDTFYADVKDGWYALSGSTIRLGLRGGVRFGSIEIAAKAGVNATGQLNAATPPFYATLGGAYAF
jgi:hypothetical protein